MYQSFNATPLLWTNWVLPSAFWKSSNWCSPSNNPLGLRCPNHLSSWCFLTVLFFGEITALIYTHIGTTFTIEKEYKQAQNYYQKGLELARKIEDQVLVLYCHRMLASYHLEILEYDKALQQARQALTISNQIGVNQNTLQIFQVLSDIHKAMGLQQKALSYQVAYYELKDSLIGSKTKQVLFAAEQEYEEKIKQRELKALEKEKKILKQRNILAIVGFGFLALLGWLVANQRKQKIKANAKINEQKEILLQQALEQEKIEQMKLKEVLDRKKRELIGNTLQIAEKNTFLQTIEQELKKGEKTNPQLIQNLLRKIKFSAVQEKDWERYINIFEEVHPSFIAQLKEQFSNLTTGEIRLCSLIKMNFQNKQIANILHISSDGVKKARYRLRKNLELKNEDSLEKFLTELC